MYDQQLQFNAFKLDSIIDMHQLSFTNNIDVPHRIKTVLSA